MTFSSREIVLAALLLAACIVWFIDRQRQGNLAATAQRQMDRYHWQADKLANWVRKDDRVKSIDVCDDTITINRVDGSNEVFSRQVSTRE